MQYLRELSCGQELFLENLIEKSATAVIIWQDTEAVGYALLSDFTILEFSLSKQSAVDPNFVLTQLVKLREVRSIFCKSFERSLVELLGGLSFSSTATAWLFRRLQSLPQKIEWKLVARLASEEDIETILSISDDFFADEDEIRSYLDPAAGLFIYSVEDRPVACGIIKRVVSCRDDYDVGMVVTPTHRQKGYATEIITHLCNYCISQDWKPIAGCEINNTASRRALEKGGLYSEHQLLKFSVK